MISLTHPTPTTARVRCGPGHDVLMPWGPELDPWRVMYLVTRGVWLAGGPGASERYGVSGHQAGERSGDRERPEAVARKVYALVRRARAGGGGERAPVAGDPADGGPAGVVGPAEEEGGGEGV